MDTFRACSYSGEAVDYHTKGGVSHGATDHRPILGRLKPEVKRLPTIKVELLV